MAMKAIELHRTRARTTIEMGRALSLYANDPSDYDADGIKKQIKAETPALLEKLLARYEGVDDWRTETLESALRAAAEEEGVSAGKLIHPTRLALTGVTVGAPLFDVVALLGRETVVRRLRKFPRGNQAAHAGLAPAIAFGFVEAALAAARLPDVVNRSLAPAGASPAPTMRGGTTGAFGLRWFRRGGLCGRPASRRRQRFVVAGASKEELSS